MFCVYFGVREVRNYRDYARGTSAETEQLNDTFRAFLRENGVYMHKRHVNRCFIGGAHDESDADRWSSSLAISCGCHRDELRP